MSAHSSPGEQHWQAAWAALHEPGWPSLAEITEQATRWQLIRGHAIRLANGERIERTPPRRAPAPAPAYVAPPLPHHQPQLDFKCLAAGDRPDRD